MNTRFGLFAGAAVLGIGLAASTPAAALILVTANINDANGGPANDCTGVFGNFGGQTADTICDVGHALTPSQNVSPIIAKQNIGGAFEISSLFPSITGGEFIISGGSGGSGTWSYTQGTDDPDVRFWVAKGGNDPFVLHWMVTEADEAGACAGDNYTLACLNAAVAVTSGNWATATGQDLSHLSWYDTGGGGDDDEVVPEPGVLFLMGAGLLGLGMSRRRKCA
jgi:hypothetical protein